MNLLEKLISKIINRFSISTNYFPPRHFSTGDIENCRKAISDLNRECRFLILGDMSELRNLAVSMGFKPEVSVDGKFDVVLSDMAFNMVNVEDNFLKGIKNILFPGGIFVVWVHFLNEALLELTAKEILDKSFGILDEGVAAAVISGRIFDKFSDFKEAIEFIREAIKSAGGKPRKKSILLRALKLTLVGGEMRRTTHNKIQLENRLSKFFDIIDVKIAGDYPDSKFYPLYVMRMRS